ncbi:MAG TPA: diguanylate cyclase [Terriglobales bacterium]|nr:diguanylate cyclase [Terriglobales bacterium]
MQRVALLYDASQAVLGTFDLDQVLNQILAIVRDYFRLEKGTVFLVDERTGHLSPRRWIGRQGNSARSIEIGKGLVGHAAQLKRPIYAPDVEKDPRYVPNLPGTRSELAIPLLLKDKVVGVLDFQSDREDYFDNETVDLLTLFATQASIGLQNATLYQLEQRRAAQLEAINAIAREAAAVLDMSEMLEKLCAVVLQHFRSVQHISVLLWENDHLFLRRSRGKLDCTLPEGQHLPAGAGLASQALIRREPVVANNVADAPGYVPGVANAVSELCLPLVSFGDPLGVLVMDNTKANAFSEDDVRALSPVADICATALQNARHYENARQLANIDGLTGIFNRRYFEQRIVEELERSARYNTPFSVVMIDIDNFKKLNDEFGHLLGDEVLRQAAQILRQQLRKIDRVCRYGGEEFAIIMPETNGPAAVQGAEKLRRTVEGWRFPGVPRPVTVSGGVAEFPAHGATRDELVRAADSALYLAKSAGRNRIVGYALNAAPA